MGTATFGLTWVWESELAQQVSHPLKRLRRPFLMSLYNHYLGHLQCLKITHVLGALCPTQVSCLPFPPPPRCDLYTGEAANTVTWDFLWDMYQSEQCMMNTLQLLSQKGGENWFTEGHRMQPIHGGVRQGPGKAACRASDGQFLLFGFPPLTSPCLNLPEHIFNSVTIKTKSIFLLLWFRSLFFSSGGELPLKTEFGAPSLSQTSDTGNTYNIVWTHRLLHTWFLKHPSWSWQPLSGCSVHAWF